MIPELPVTSWESMGLPGSPWDLDFLGILGTSWELLKVGGNPWNIWESLGIPATSGNPWGSLGMLRTPNSFSPR